MNSSGKWERRGLQVPSCWVGNAYRLCNGPQLQYGADAAHEQHHFGLPAVAACSLDMHLFTRVHRRYEHKGFGNNRSALSECTEGDKGNVMLAVVNPIIELNLSSHFKANMEVSYYYRHIIFLP